MPACVSIAVIAKNEEQSIGVVLSQILAVMQRYAPQEYDLFVVDGYSTDNTASIALGLGVAVFRVAGGKGEAVRQAFSLANKEYVLFFDADGSHVPEDIPRLVESAQNSDADLVIVSRKSGGSEELGRHNPDTLLRLWGNFASTAIVNFRWGSRLTDIQNGFRIIKRRVGLELNLQESGFAIEQEMVIKCLRARKKISEIPGLERKRQFGRSKVCKHREFWKYLFSLAKGMK